MRSIIAEDEAAARSRLSRLLADYPDITLVGEAQDGLRAVQRIEALRPDLLFLDIELPELSGFEVLKSVRESIPLPLVIFVTGYDQHALAAFEANALAYLLKPSSQKGWLRPSIGRVSCMPQMTKGNANGSMFCTWRANRENPLPDCVPEA
jgi:DNA-binding LytR/AlgR family response regulator